MKIKALAAAVALGVAGNASAAIYDGALSTAGFASPAAGQQGAELFISVVDRGAVPSSYVLDLGITADAFRTDDTAFFGNIVDQGLIDFVTTATGTISWNIGGVSNGLGVDTDFTDFGIFTTAANAITSANAPQALPGLSGAAQRLQTYVSAVNSAAGTTNIADNIGYLETNAANTSFHDGGLWGATWTGGGFGSTEGGLDQSLDFYYMSLDSVIAPTGISTLVSSFGQWTLGADGILSYGNVSAVPVPAAVWLFGSGLLGLVGVARRRKDA